ncbi:anti-sigma factor antagonist [Marinibacterium profundimaris]|uniref:STAS domain-containing protein n=1 Tax=Marinibacterium profundimaris TaxID=1679460 RepID=A0A225NIA9_9RHOB|nr:anti-sigma factor antagonist [Marinibacterium profundimaris]OWU73464.1 hypothetical protein ATO3_12395 [Marinibacterium profundimaris]
MASFAIGGIEECRLRLASSLDDGVEVVRLTEADTFDTCGAQLLASAVQTARSRGRDLAIQMPEGGEALRLWQSLGLDALCRAEPVTTGFTAPEGGTS